MLALLPESGKGGGQTLPKAGDASCKGSGMPGVRGIRLNRQNGPVYYLDPSGVDDPEISAGVSRMALARSVAV